MKYFENIKKLNEYYKVDVKHPLIDIRRYSDIIPLVPLSIEPLIFDFYNISFLKNFNGNMEYGNTKFTDTSGGFYFVQPGQIYSYTSTTPFDGYQILVHPDIYKSHLSKKNIETYNFFYYDINESLLLTKEEENEVNLLMNRAWNELNNKKDDFSIPIVLSYVSILLNISERFYSRQFNARKRLCNKLSSGFLFKKT